MQMHAEDGAEAAQKWRLPAGGAVHGEARQDGAPSGPQRGRQRRQTQVPPPLEGGELTSLAPLLLHEYRPALHGRRPDITQRSGMHSVWSSSLADVSM
ncbi:hypothetical protein MRX96_053482 [Rhipicephalus microplus]